MNTLQKLYNHLEKIYHFQSIVSLLSWDQETYMPEKAFQLRSKQLGIMASIIHQQKTTELKKFLNDVSLDDLSGKEFLIVNYFYRKCS